MSKTVRIGFVGAGNMGQSAHLRNFATLPECRVVALAEPRADLAKRVAQKYGIPAVYANAAEMLAHEELDGIVAPQPFEHHGTLITPLYEAGIPILTEKPLASSIPVGEAMVAAMEKGGSWHMVGYHKRSDPAAMYARAEIERLNASGELGPMRYVRISIPAGDWISGGFFDLVRTDEPVPKAAADPRPSDMDSETYAAYVSFVNYYIHQVNFLRFLFGESYRVAYADPAGVLLAAESESGMTGVIEMSPYRTTVDWQESALIAFERGWIKLELPAPLALNRPGRVELFSDPGNGVPPKTVIPQLPAVHAMRQQAINFVRAIKGEAKPPCDAREALEDLKTAREYFQVLEVNRRAIG